MGSSYLHRFIFFEMLDKNMIEKENPEEVTKVSILRTIHKKIMDDRRLIKEDGQRRLEYINEVLERWSKKKN